MNNDVRHYVKSCDSCQRIKASQQVPAGLLQPLPIPSTPWEQVSMDFITQLPVTKAGFDTIVVFVDTFSKMVHFVPTHTTAMAQTLPASSSTMSSNSTVCRDDLILFSFISHLSVYLVILLYL